VAIERDGKIVAVGNWHMTVAVDENHSESVGTGLALARYNTDGSLDRSFGTDGKVTAGAGAADVAVQADGKIIVTDVDLGLARYLPEGRLDPSFGNRGRVGTHFTSKTSGSASELAVQGDGKLVVAGSAGKDGSNSDFAVARYLPDGRLDPAFGSGGRVLTDFGRRGQEVVGLALQRDGKIVAVGEADLDYALVRYLPDGRLDHTFGSGGRVLASLGGGFVSALSVQSDGRIVVTGSSYRSDEAGYKFALDRYLPDGRLDPGFDRDGRVATSLSGWDSAYAAAMQRDGKIIAGGTWSWSYSCGDNCETDKDAFALARYLPDGRLDPSFGGAAGR